MSGGGEGSLPSPPPGHRSRGSSAAAGLRRPPPAPLRSQALPNHTRRGLLPTTLPVDARLATARPRFRITSERAAPCPPTAIRLFIAHSNGVPVVIFILRVHVVNNPVVARSIIPVTVSTGNALRSGFEKYIYQCIFFFFYKIFRVHFSCFF